MINKEAVNIIQILEKEYKRTWGKNAMLLREKQSDFGLADLLTK